MPMTEEQKKLVEDNIKLAWHLTHKWSKKGVYLFDIEEMFSLFSFALCKAGLTFKSDKGVRFSTYAGRCMENEIKMAFRTKFNSREHNELSFMVESIAGELVDCTKYLTNEDHLQYDIFLDITVINEAIKILDEREIKILKLRYYDGKKQEDIARELNISRTYVCRLEKKALGKLYEWYVENNAD
jgi:RNA polymerase sporulation-specific sigma factor